MRVVRWASSERSDGSDHRLVVGAVSAKIRADVETGFRRFNSGQDQRLPHLEQGGRSLLTNL